MKWGSSDAPGCDNIPSELLKSGNDTNIDALHEICNSLWRKVRAIDSIFNYSITNERNLGKFSSYGTISFISNPSTALLQIINNRIDFYQVVVQFHTEFLCTLSKARLCMEHCTTL